jgi:hypothetical protein
VRAAVAHTSHSSTAVCMASHLAIHLGCPQHERKWCGGCRS